jgi:Zn-dependent M28 family amino/carboxypeptidase
MQQWRAPCALLACVIAAVPAFAQTSAVSPQAVATADVLRERALAGTDAHAIAEALTVEVGPRPAGSEGDRAAVAWALTKMQDLGLSGVHAEAVTVPHWERGTAEVRIVDPYAQKLTATSLGGSVGTDENGIEAPVLEVADLDELALLPQRAVQGTIVYFSARMEPSKDGATYIKAVRTRTLGPAEAGRRGAVGTLIRSIGTSAGRFAHTGATRYDAEVPPIPALALAHADADLLERELASGAPVVAHIHSTARSLPSARSANVIGEVPGRGQGIVLLAAHLDSWDLGTGAIDDAAGVGIVLATAHLLAQQRIELGRRVRVVLYANEEFGLSGATAYASEHAEELAQHVVGMEADFGTARVWRIDSRVDPAAQPLVDAVHAALAPLGIEPGGNEANGGADLGALRDQGMPVIELWQDGTHYFDYHHTADDTLDKLDRDALDQAVAAFATTAYIAAAAESDFGRLPPPEKPAP